MELVMRNDHNVMSYTGVPTKHLLLKVQDMIEKHYPVITYWRGRETTKRQHQCKQGAERVLTTQQELVCTLTRLRTGWTEGQVADQFDVSRSHVSKLFVTYIHILDEITKPIRQWPDTDVIRKYLPPSVRKDFPKTTIIIDCAEFFIKKPRNATAQSQTYSQYKTHNTYKALFGIHAGGAFTFASDLWTGNVSDRFITENSGFMDHIQYGDQVMADRGFTIRDLLADHGATLVIPPFTRRCQWGKGKWLTNAEQQKTRLIAKHRIHVERAIQRLKLFRLLTSEVPSSMADIMDAGVRVASSLCNLQPPLNVK